MSKLVNLLQQARRIARSLIPAIEGAPSLTRLKAIVALRHEVKKELTANAARVSALSLVVYR